MQTIVYALVAELFLQSGYLCLEIGNLSLKDALVVKFRNTFQVQTDSSQDMGPSGVAITVFLNPRGLSLNRYELLPVRSKPKLDIVLLGAERGHECVHFGRSILDRVNSRVELFKRLLDLSNRWRHLITGQQGMT